VTEREWPAPEIERFLKRAERGTVALVLDGGKARLATECRLPGTYTEAAARQGEGRYWATNRLLLLPEEAGPECAHATHLAGAFAVRKTASGGGAPRFAAILLPLPCPPISDTRPAAGCVGRGRSGPQRAHDARALIKAQPEERRGDPAETLDIYALAPDDWAAQQSLARIGGECTLSAHAQWIVRHFGDATGADGERIIERTKHLEPPYDAPPRFDESLSQRSCLYQPAFRKCFAGIFDPSPGSTGCWEPAKSGKAAPR
jgi:hypothetical protein